MKEEREEKKLNRSSNGLMEALLLLKILERDEKRRKREKWRGLKKERESSKEKKHSERGKKNLN